MKKYKKMYIEITNVCNLECRFCPPTKRAKEFMSIGHFTQILDKIKEHADFLYFHVKGEPLLHPDLDKFLDICFEKGFKVNITTNGTRLRQLKDMLLTKPAIKQMHISLQSYEEQKDEQRTHYMEEVLDFVKEAIKNTSMKIELRLWNLELKDTNEANVQRNEALLRTIERALGLNEKLEEKICKGKGVKIAEGIYLSQSYEFEWPGLEKEVVSDRGFCYGLRNQIAILVDGTVVPCCLDSEGDIPLGNIIEVDHFEDIVTGNRAQTMVDGFSCRQVREPLCQSCGYRTRFDDIKLK